MSNRRVCPPPWLLSGDDRARLSCGQFDADSKTLFKWIKRKDEAKRFSSLLKESRLAAYRHAGPLHATTRAVLITKLSHLQSAFLDNTSLLGPKFEVPFPPHLLWRAPPSTPPVATCAMASLTIFGTSRVWQVLITALRLAAEEVTWWALHADAVPDELSRKERDAERDTSCYHPASVESLLRLTAALTKSVHTHQALLAESASARMLMHKEELTRLFAAVSAEVALPSESAALLRDLPLHVQHAADVNCDLRGLRLNALRIVCALSAPQLMTIAMASPPLTNLLKEVHATANLSLAIDASEPLLRSTTEPTALFADPTKLERIFACALDAKPTDCLVLLGLAARATSASATSPLPSMLERMADRINTLLRELAEHFRAQRSNPHGVPSVLDTIHKATTLCQALDSSPPLIYSRPNGPPVSVNLQAWLREQFEDMVEAHVKWIVFPSPSSAGASRASIISSRHTLHACTRCVHARCPVCLCLCPCPCLCLYLCPCVAHPSPYTFFTPRRHRPANANDRPLAPRRPITRPRPPRALYQPRCPCNARCGDHA